MAEGARELYSAGQPGVGAYSGWVRVGDVGQVDRWEVVHSQLQVQSVRLLLHLLIAIPQLEEIDVQVDETICDTSVPLVCRVRPVRDVAGSKEKDGCAP